MPKDEVRTLKKAPAAAKPTPRQEAPRAQAAATAPSNEAKRAYHWPPAKLVQYARGMITLADLDGLTQEQLSDMAQVGYTLLSQGRLQDAQKIFTGLAVLNPYQPYFHLALGSIAQKTHEDKEAEKHYTRALETNQSIGFAYVNRAEVRISLGDMQGAISDLIKAVKLSTQNPQDPSGARAKATLSAIKKRVNELQKEGSGT